VVTEQTKLIETLERKYEYNSDKLDTLKREVSELGKVVQKTKSKPKMAALKAKMVQIKRDEQALLQMQGQLDNVTLLKRQLQDSAITAETFRVIKLATDALKRATTLVGDIDDIMIESEDLLRQQRESSEALSKPIDSGEMPMDEDELWAALKEINQEVDELALADVAEEDGEDASDAQLLRELQELEVEMSGLPSPAAAVSVAVPPTTGATAVAATQQQQDELGELLALANNS